MIKADFIGFSPSIEVENTNFIRSNTVTITIGELVIDVTEKDAKYLMSALDNAMYSETKEDLDNKVSELQEEIERLNALLINQEVA